jgi:hypothetical protein
MSTLFFKSTPQITITEMCGDLPSIDAMFEASSDEEFSQLVAVLAAPKGSQSLKDLITSLLGEGWDGPETPMLAHITAEHTISIIFGSSAL